MAHPIPDDRVEEERRKMRFRQVRGVYRRRIRERRIELLGLVALLSVFGLATLFWWIKQLISGGE